MEMTRRHFLWLSLCAAPVAAKGVLDWQRENLLIADRLERSRARGRFYVIKPELAASDKQFRGYPIRGQAPLSDPNLKRLLAALSKALHSYSISDGVVRCFNPRHGLRLERNGRLEAELLICFECSQLYYFSQGRPLHGYLRGGESAFQAVARANGLPVVGKSD